MKYYSGIERRAFEEGRQLGIQIGLQQSLSAIVLSHLNLRLGELKPTIIKSIELFSVSQLAKLTDALLDFSTMSDLNKWLRENGKSVSAAKATKAKNR